MINCDYDAIEKAIKDEYVYQVESNKNWSDVFKNDFIDMMEVMELTKNGESENVYEKLWKMDSVPREIISYIIDKNVLTSSQKSYNM